MQETAPTKRRSCIFEELEAVLLGLKPFLTTHLLASLGKSGSGFGGVCGPIFNSK